MILQLVRSFHVGFACRAAETSLLATLRKKTGYTIANCKKALEMHKNDPDKAEAWLQEQAQAMGWAKAGKVAGRAASQGLVAVRCDGRHAALVELNCETDFVARNETFRNVVEQAADACFKLSHTRLEAKGPLTKMSLDAEQLGSLPCEGKTLAERVALMIGSVGENAVLRRAQCWSCNEDDVRVAAYTHPSPATAAGAYSAGKYGALLAYRGGDDDLGRKICQHVVGMNPRAVGGADDAPAADADDETRLIFQEFLLEPGVTVGELMRQHELEVVEYVRFACGEDSDPARLPGVEKQPLDSVQTLQ